MGGAWASEIKGTEEVGWKMHASRRLWNSAVPASSRACAGALLNLTLSLIRHGARGEEPFHFV